ncbi:type I DNA topoisomerase [Candidatus Saccharibacteria bacterium]|nr:type I DNA topoisomerase [Candidatus Saccharibacteria bacterium]
MKLVIVESPTKAKTLSKFLGGDYEVASSMGHVYDLPKKEFGVDVEHDFKPQYKVVPGKTKVVGALRKAAKKAGEVYLATDPDREGESIAWHIKQAVGDGKTKRVAFHEITERAVKEAFKHPRDVNQDLVDSQQARRVLDRLVGYKLSPLLWKKVRYGLSAGRVQSVAVRLIVEREREREAFHPEEYWEVAAKLQTAGRPDDRTGREFEAKLIEKNGEKIKIGLKEDADKVIKELEGVNYKVSSLEKKERKRNPYPPFTTSTLQQAGVNVFGFSARRTMRAAQSLYEAGLITYHRTDSTAMAPQALERIRNFVSGNYGGKYLPKTAKQYKTRVKLAQEAHEAIRPTRPDVISGKISKIGGDEKKIYDLIWRRAVASQMLPALYEQLTVGVEAGSYGFRATGSKVTFDGWEIVFRDLQTQNGDKEEDGGIPELKEGEALKLLKLLPSQHFTEPPARYTEATLIKKLEEEGIGRPSTYAPIIHTIQARGYVLREGRSLKPDDAGVVVNDLLVSYFPDIVDVSFTAKMEDNLDEIAKGQVSWVKPIADFYGPFAEELEKAEENIDKSSMTTIEETEEKCPESGHPLVIKLGRYGKFYSCSNFPDCKYSRPFVEKIGMICPECGEGEVVVRRTKKRGRTFYGCSRFPDCKFASWKDPRKPKGDKVDAPKDAEK